MSKQKGNRYLEAVRRRTHVVEAPVSNLNTFDSRALQIEVMINRIADASAAARALRVGKENTPTLKPPTPQSKGQGSSSTVSKVRELKIRGSRFGDFFDID